jgi:hypothetical protein
MTTKAEENIVNNVSFFLKGNKYQVCPQGEVGDSKHFYVFKHIKHGNYSNPYSAYYSKEWSAERILAALLDDISIGLFDVYDR